MKCSICLYEENCNLKNVAPDLTGCDGHSKLKPPKENQSKCCCCLQWKDNDGMFHHSDGNKHICFECW